VSQRYHRLHSVFKLLNESAILFMKDMKRPSVSIEIDSKALKALAQRAEYTGSVEHKDRSSWLGLPRPRRSKNPAENATICPLVTRSEKEKASSWVRYAIENEQFLLGYFENGFPRSLWFRDVNGQCWQGRLTQCGAGELPIAEYKGWPISEEEKREIFD
jgi:hypothetical protein